MALHASLKAKSKAAKEKGKLYVFKSLCVCVLLQRLCFTLFTGSTRTKLVFILKDSNRNESVDFVKQDSENLCMKEKLLALVNGFCAQESYNYSIYTKTLGTKSQMIIHKKDYLAGLFTPFEEGKRYMLLVDLTIGAKWNLLLAINSWA